MAYEGLMVSVSGIRGRVGEALTPEVMSTFAAGFGAWASARHGNNAIVVGRDSRVSGPMFHRVVLGALQSVGCRVIDVGMAPTPTIQMAVEHHRAAGGLAITASHNPVEWNALKFIGSSGLFLDGTEAVEMRESVEAGFTRVTWDRLGTVETDLTACQRHVEAILALPWLDVKGIRAKRFVVALDCCHGAGPTVFPALLEALGCEVHGIGMTPDGRFPRSPEPIAENLKELEAEVRRSGAVVGLATDPDVDRLALVDETGRSIGEDWTLALATRVVLRHKSGPVVTNLSTSRILDDVAARLGARVLRAPVGEVNVAVRMRSEGSPIGGEGNGGVILPELHLGRDAPVGAALILQLLSDEARPLSAIVAEYPRYAIVKDKLDRPAGALSSVYAALEQAFPDGTVDRQDGLRLSWPDRWVHVRPSGTEPIVRVIAEAPTEAEARTLIRRSREPLDALARG